MRRIVGVDIGGETGPWESIGLRVADSRAVVGSVTLRFVGGESRLHRVLVDDPDGLFGSTVAQDRSDGLLRSDAVAFEIDGAAWGVGDPDAETGVVPERPGHPLGATLIDHLVLMTPDLHRTCGAIESTLGEPLKRVRDAGNGVQQGFFRLGEVIVEVVQAPQVPAGGSSWWGLVVVVEDLSEITARLGPDVISAPREAVQPGRSIASVRGSVGLGMPVALMSR